MNRVPPTESKGRVHTSIITVAIIDSESSAGQEKYFQRTKSDFKFEIFKSSGPGGQNRNKVSSGVKCIHIPTGLKQERTTKCQHSNKRMALEALNRMLDERIQTDKTSDIHSQRTDSIGSGKRGERIRTYKFQDGVVINHKTNRRMPIKQFFRGKINTIWE